MSAKHVCTSVTVTVLVLILVGKNLGLKLTATGVCKPVTVFVVGVLVCKAMLAGGIFASVALAVFVLVSVSSEIRGHVTTAACSVPVVGLVAYPSGSIVFVCAGNVFANVTNAVLVAVRVSSELKLCCCSIVTGSRVPVSRSIRGPVVRVERVLVRNFLIVLVATRNHYESQCDDHANKQ